MSKFKACPQCELYKREIAELTAKVQELRQRADWWSHAYLQVLKQLIAKKPKKRNTERDYEVLRLRTENPREWTWQLSKTLKDQECRGCPEGLRTCGANDEGDWVLHRQDGEIVVYRSGGARLAGLR